MAITIASGDFTIIKYLRHLNREDLERTVGFDKGRLGKGSVIVVLSEHERLSADDFELGASTRWSGGKIPRRVGGHAKIENLLIERGQDLGALKQKVAEFFARRGDNTPAKVLPNRNHTSGMVYPDAEALGPGIRSGVMSFKLLNPKQFEIFRTI
jgi:hypothetical protein